MESSVNTLIDDLLWPTAEVTRTIAAVAKGDLSRTMRLDVDGRPLQGEFLRSATHREHHDRADERLHLRSDAGGARGRHGRQARRAGAGERRVGRVEGPDRQRELHGEQPDRAGAQHRRGDDRGGERRPLAQDHGGRARRDPPVEGSHQHDGGPASLVRVGSDAGGARGRHRRQARRSGDRAGRGGHVERPDRLGQRDGDQPHGSGAQHRGSDDGGRARRPVAQDHGGRERRDSRAQEHHQHDGRPVERVRRRSDAGCARSRHRRQARRPGAGAGCRGHVERPDRQRELDGRQPDRAGAEHRGGGDRHRERRPVAQDHGGRERRDPAAEGNAQHDGRAAALVRVGSDAGRARGRNRRLARRPGDRAGRRRARGKT